MSKSGITFDLISNAEDSVNHAIELLAYGANISASVKYKRVIQSIFHAIELLLKERLRQIHPALIWENIDKYPSLEARTVTSDLAISRLTRIGGVIFSDDELKIIQALKRNRNAIEHYKWSISTDEADYIVGKALAFVIYFSNTHLKYNFFGYAHKKNGTFQDIIESNAHFINFYRILISQKDSLITTNCVFCKAIFDKNDTTCPKCGSSNFSSSNFSDFFEDGEF